MRWLAFSWGFAEATLFFVVPEVLITWLALDRLRRAITASLLTLFGAMAGGALMYWWGAVRHDQALAVVERVPAVSVEMLADIEVTLGEHGVLAMIPGAFIGRPYKAYAVQSSTAGIAWLPFLLATVPARLIRFLLAAAVTSGLARLAHRWPQRRRRAVLIAFWVTLYALFWTLMPN
jgi:membrane protein YqaA with SNARE-associated domain